MTIERICVRPGPGAPTRQRLRVQLVAGKGIEGDRYFGVDGEPSVNVTLVEAEEIERFQRECGVPVDLSVTGRNFVTRGVRLNALVGREFSIGGVRLLGSELCEPCLTLGQALANPSCGPAEAVKRMLRRGGLRARVLTSGEVAVGARVDFADR